MLLRARLLPRPSPAGLRCMYRSVSNSSNPNDTTTTTTTTTDTDTPTPQPSEIFDTLRDARQKSFEKQESSKKPGPQPPIVPEAAETVVDGTLHSSQLGYKPLEVKDQPPVPNLAHDLDRVLFNPGVHFLRDPRSHVYNFTTFLEKIMSIKDFDFSKIPSYVPSGKDSKLANLAEENGKRFIGSTSSLTGVLTKLHHAISHKRPPVIRGLSKNFPGEVTKFTEAQSRPISIYLRYNNYTDTYAIDADKAANEDIILSVLGHALEAMLTTPEHQFKKYHKSKSHKIKGDHSASTYNYTQCGNVLMRSQLDCHDPRLPGTGMFDLKTRAVSAARHDIDYVQVYDGTDYQIESLQGPVESFEMEWFELIRSQMFKYSLQARIGRMDGIFVAYHNIRRFFGFQYVPLSEMDAIFHTAQLKKVRDEMVIKRDNKMTPEDIHRTAETEFTLSVNLMERILQSIAMQRPKHSYNIVINASHPGELTVFAKPMRARHIAQIQNNAVEPDKPVCDNLDKYIPNQDPHSIWKHASEHPSFVMPDLEVYKVDLRNVIGGEPVPHHEFPSLLASSPDDEWKLDYNVQRVQDHKSKSLLYESCFQDRPYVLREVTSSPQLKRLRSKDAEAARLRNALKQLTPPTGLQRYLRRLAMQGGQRERLRRASSPVLWTPRSLLDKLRGRKHQS